LAHDVVGEDFIDSKVDCFMTFPTAILLLSNDTRLLSFSHHFPTNMLKYIVTVHRKKEDHS